MPADIVLRDILERLALVLMAEGRRTPGLLPTHRALLRFLSRANRYSNTPGAAATYLGQTKGTVSQSLGVLERKRLVRKTRDEADGRVVRLQLTAKGQRLLARDPDGAQAALAQLHPDEADRAITGLGRILQALRGATGGRTFGSCPSCRWLRREQDGARCGLTGDTLAAEETGRLCIEHDPPEPAGGD